MNRWTITILSVGIVTLILLVAVVILLNNEEGIGAIILDLAFTTLVQGLVAVLLLGIVLTILIGAIPARLRLFLQPLRLTGLFFATAIMAMAFTPALFGRRLGLIDFVVTLLLTAVFSVLFPIVKPYLQPYLEPYLERIEAQFTRTRRQVPQPTYTAPPGFSPLTRPGVTRPSSGQTPLIIDEEEITQAHAPTREDPYGFSQIEPEEPVETQPSGGEGPTITQEPVESDYAWPSLSTSQPANSNNRAGIYDTSGEIDHSSTELQLYQELLQRVERDHKAAARLIAEEYRRSPEASREELIRRAIERWEANLGNP